jgi:aryl-alcohol dehydrogenase-like predicted oxidoreductase
MRQILQLPRIGLGMAALGRPGYINLHRQAVLGDADDRSVAAMRRQAHLVLDRLFQLVAQQQQNQQQQKNEAAAGAEEDTINPCCCWIDCARSYGLSEQFVGEYLRARKALGDQPESKEDPQVVIVTSKWGYKYVADFQVSLDPGVPHEVKDHSVDTFHQQLAETKALIGDHVVLYQIHSATFDSGILTDHLAHQELAKAKETLGWKMGLSVSGPAQGDVIRTALNIKTLPSPSSSASSSSSSSSPTPLFDSVQCTWNVLEQSAGPALLEAYETGRVTIIVKEGLANGRVFANEHIVAAARDLATTPDALALACILAQPFRPSVLSGAVTPDQLSSNFAAGPLLARDDFHRLLPTLLEQCRMDSQAYWDERSQLAWN